MKKTWEQEKAYEVRRAKVLGEQMDAAIATGDMEAFTTAYQTAHRYMTNKQRTPYFMRWLREGRYNTPLTEEGLI